MRQIMIVLIAILALSLLTPTIWAVQPLLVSSPKNLTISHGKDYLLDPAQMTLVTTPSIAAFLGENWIPGIAQNYTYGFSPLNIYSSQPGNIEAPGSIIEFMGQNWTSTQPVVIGLTNEEWPGYTKGVMS